MLAGWLLLTACSTFHSFLWFLFLLESDSKTGISWSAYFATIFFYRLITISSKNDGRKGVLLTLKSTVSYVRARGVTVELKCERDVPAAESIQHLLP